MNHRTKNHLVLLGGACAAVAFLLPSGSVAFSLVGGSLGVSTSNYQRDVRVWNNTADAAANNNTIADPNFPGALGAVMAVWKGAKAWGSEAANTARNFDYDFQGTAATNSNNQNTVSWQAGGGNCSGGTLAYTLLPISDGWTIRMCDNFNWSDGPGNPGTGQIDIQGVAAHELGHALGLGHSNSGCGGSCSNDATMCPFVCGGGVASRDTEVDDQNGTQAVYGAIPSNKPVITSLSGSFNPGGTLIINGANFAGTVNVKFTAGSSQNNGAIPGAVFNVPATSTQVSVVIPASAQDGNVLVWEPGLGRLSNAFPIDIGTGGPGPGTCDPPMNYGLGETGPNGLATIGSTGSPEVGAAFAITGSGLPSNVGGSLALGTAQANTPAPWGTLLVGGTISTIPVFTNPSGAVSVSLNVTASMVGTTLFFQYVCGGQHTGGLKVTFCE